MKSPKTFIVAFTALALATALWKSTADLAARREAAGDALRWEQGRVAAGNEARLRERNARWLKAEFARSDDRMQDEREKLREQEGLRRSRKELEDATFELQQAQDRASR